MLEANELIPLYLLDDRRCVLLDSGLAKERDEIEKTLLEAGLEPAGILCSHAHVDHCANNRYFQEKYHLPVALTAPEAGMCSSILNLKCYRLLVSPDAAEQEMSEMVHVPDLILPPVDGPIGWREHVPASCTHRGTPPATSVPSPRTTCATPGTP